MKDLVIFLCGLMAGLWLSSVGGLWEADQLVATPDKAHVVEVKRSLSGLCHPKGSQFYDYLKFYTEYDSLTQCVLEGGRLPVKVRENVWLYDNYSDFNSDGSLVVEP